MDPIKEIFLKRFIDWKKKLIAELAPPPEILEFNAKVKEVDVKYVKLRALGGGNPDDFAKLALNQLKEFKDGWDDEEYEIFKAIYYALDYPGLLQPLQSKMDRGVQLLEKRIDYFCSYTRKGLPEINSNYESIIRKVFGIAQDTHPKEWRENNYVAVLVVKYLNDHGFNSYFFDNDKIVNGEFIQDTVYQYCEHTTVLLLLAQQETFRDSKKETNWCYEEYKHYTASHARQRYQVFTVPGLVEPVKARQAIRDWYRRMTTAKGIKGKRLDFDLSPNGVRTYVNEMAVEIGKAREDSFMDILYG